MRWVAMPQPPAASVTAIALGLTLFAAAVGAAGATSLARVLEPSA